MNERMFMLCYHSNDRIYFITLLCDLSTYFLLIITTLI